MIMLRQLVPACIFLSAPAFAQEAWKAPRKAHGAPDLEGVWTNLSATPLERPTAFDALTTTEERAAAFVKASREAFFTDENDGIGGRQSEWWEMSDEMTRIDGEIRTSAIVDPPNGRMPYSAAGRALLAKAQHDNLNIYDHPEARPATERCLAGGRELDRRKATARR